MQTLCHRPENQGFTGISVVNARRAEAAFVKKPDGLAQTLPAPGNDAIIQNPAGPELVEGSSFLGPAALAPKKKAVLRRAQDRRRWCIGSGW
jgi:hypothetical protein